MKRIRRVLIIGDGRRSRIRKFSEHIHELVKPLVQTVRLELDPAKDLSRVKADLMVIIGGDGSILSTADRMGRNQIKSIGIQMGRFGFLSELTPTDCEENLKRIISGEGVVKERMMISCRVRNGGRTEFRGRALNDAVLASSSSSRMVMVELNIDDMYVTTFHGDGVIVATPVGSTAHSLSAGGAIMEPSLRAFIITPICSHALTIRPLVVNEQRTIRLRSGAGRNRLRLTLDGQRVHKLDAGEEVEIKVAPVSFRLLRVEDRSYFETLRQKFYWGGTLIADAPSALWSRNDGKNR
jgi:NAD+ kinase